jgi:hypothetical protein
LVSANEILCRAPPLVAGVASVDIR